MALDNELLKTDLSKALPDSMVGERVVDVAATIGDVALDAAIASGMFDGIPIIGAITGLAKAGLAVKDRLFAKKVLQFLQEFERTPLQARSAFMDNLRAKGTAEKFGEQVILLIDRMDDFYKPQVIARLIGAAAEGHITLDQAIRTSKLVDRAFSEDLEAFGRCRGRFSEQSEIAEALFFGGLFETATVYGEAVDEPDFGRMTYRANAYGQLLLRFGLNVLDHDTVG